jgi:hypothetical protein
MRDHRAFVHYVVDIYRFRTEIAPAATRRGHVGVK